MIPGANDQHESVYAWEWLYKHSHLNPKDRDKGNKEVKQVSQRCTVSKVLTTTRRMFWGAEISSSPPSVEYEAVMMTESGVATLTDKIVRLATHICAHVINDYSRCAMDSAMWMDVR